MVGQTDERARFANLFGDLAIERERSASWSPSEFVSELAAVHPLEDWAETFAEYTRVVERIGSSTNHDGVQAPTRARELSLVEVLDGWRPGRRLEPGTHIVADKLAFVHAQVTAHDERGRFYAEVDRVAVSGAHGDGSA